MTLNIHNFVRLQLENRGEPQVYQLDKCFYFSRFMFFFVAKKHFNYKQPIKFSPDQTFLSLCHRRHVNSNTNHCLFSEIPSDSVRVRHTRAAAAAHPVEFEVSRCRTSQFATCFLPAQTRVQTFFALCLTPERLMGLREHSIVGCFPEFVFQFSVVQVLYGCVSNL